MIKQITTVSRAHRGHRVLTGQECHILSFYSAASILDGRVTRVRCTVNTTMSRTVSGMTAMTMMITILLLLLTLTFITGTCTGPGTETTGMSPLQCQVTCRHVGLRSKYVGSSGPHLSRRDRFSGPRGHRSLSAGTMGHGRRGHPPVQHCYNGQEGCSQHAITMRSFRIGIPIRLPTATSLLLESEQQSV